MSDRRMHRDSLKDNEGMNFLGRALYLAKAELAYKVRKSTETKYGKKILELEAQVGNLRDELRLKDGELASGEKTISSMARELEHLKVDFLNQQRRLDSALATMATSRKKLASKSYMVYAFNGDAVQETLAQLQSWMQELSLRSLDRLLPQAVWHDDVLPTSIKPCRFHNMEPARAPNQVVKALEQSPRPPFGNLVRKLVCHGCHSLFPVFAVCKNCHLRLCFFCLKDPVPVVSEPTLCEFCCIRRFAPT